MCRVGARGFRLELHAQAEGGIVNIIAMTDVSACHWGSAGSSVPRRNPCVMARKLVQENLYPNSDKQPKKVEIPRVAGRKSLPKQRKSGKR